MLDDADRSALPDRLDPSGLFRIALRTALVAAAAQPAYQLPGACDRELVRTARCTSHPARRVGADGPGA